MKRGRKGPDEERDILGHLSGFHGHHADPLHAFSELMLLGHIVEPAPAPQAPGDQVQNVLANDRLSENGAAQDVTDRLVRGPMHCPGA